MMKIFTLPVTLLAFILTTATVYATQTISIKGFAYSVEKPDMAHVFIKITGEGKNYTASEKEVNRKLSEIKDLVREILGKDVSPIIIKTESKVKSKFNTGNYEEYTQEYFLKMAKAIKGDISEKLPLKEEEYTTIKNIYFSTSEYSTNQLDELKNTLASKKLAFNEADIYDFLSSFEFNKSYVLYGLSDPNMYLEKLTKKTYENATIKANHIVKAIDKKLGKLTNIDKGCNNEIEGGIDISDANKLLGKQLGPVSSNPLKLPLKYKLKYTFEIE